MGPVEAWDLDGRPVRVTHGQQRVLAEFLLTPNRSVSSDTLREELWPGETAEKASALLHTNVWSLKNLFGRRGNESTTPFLRRRDTAYELRVDPLQFDWLRYQRLRDAATRAISAERLADAKAYLLGARRLWRGEPLLGLSTDDFVLPFVGLLNAARAEETLALLEVGLALGEHQQLIPQLRLLTERNPLDEGLTRMLMLALFRSGRQADAIQAYDNCRARLAVAGLVPTPRLSQTEMDILSRAPAAMAPSTESRPPALSGISGTVLLGRWPDHTPPTWAQSDAELILSVENAGGQLTPIRGPSTVARFDDTGSALDAAVAIQDGLKARQSPLGRFVIHDGSWAVARGSRLLDLCERLLAEATSGQILVIRSADPQAGRTADGVELRELGEHHVAGSDPGVRLFQLMTSELPEMTRPFVLRAPTPKFKLPVFTGRLVGRGVLIEELALRLSRGRLVTLVGAGGSGKTRLAADAVRTLMSEYLDGTFLIELEWLTDDEMVAGTIADELGIDKSRSSSVAGLLLREVADRQLLLVLDHCEHLGDGLRTFVDRLLASCPRVSIVATSQRPLGCDHEELLVVPPLHVPGDGPVRASAAQLRACSAVELFCDSLGATAVTDDDLTPVSQICRLVDGMPLAILLAAARARQLGPATLASALEKTLGRGDGLHLLDAEGRLRRTLEWSFSLLGDTERRLLARLSLFGGPFSLAEVTEFCVDVPESDVAGSICNLANFSAIVVEGDGVGDTRYRLLGPVKDFVAAKLKQDAVVKARLSRRHAEMYLRVAEEADRQLGGPLEDHHLVRLDERLGNLRAALTWAIGAEEAALALGLAGSLWRFWFARGHLTEGLRFLLEALALEKAPSSIGIRALGGSSYLSWWTGDLEYTRKSAEETATLAGLLDDGWGRAWAPLGIIAAGMFSSSGPPSTADLRPAVAYFVENRLPWEACQALQLLGGIEWHRGAYRLAEEAFGRALELNRAAGSQTFMDVLQAHGLVLALRGEVAEGVNEIQTGLELADRRGDRVGICHALAYRAAVARYQSDFDESARLYTLALRIAHDIGEAWILQWALDGLAAWAAPTQSDVGARLLGHVEALAAFTGIKLAPREREDHAAAVRHAHEKLGATACDRAFAEGGRLSTAEAVSLALGLEA